MTNIIEELNEQKRKVDFNSYTMSVKELLSMIQENLINIAPIYQRQFRWDEIRQSLLIESLFLGIPVPSLFMATNEDGTWEVIDGVQRLSTIANFVLNADDTSRNKIGSNNPLKIQNLEKLSSFNNKRYSDLPRSLQIDFLLRPINITTLSDKSDKSVRFDLFERLNTGGIKLSEQEIRSCIYRGEFNDFIKDLSTYDNFLKCIKLPKASDCDGTKEELVLRFFAYLNSRQDFVHNVKSFLNDYMEKSSKSFNYKENRKLFHRTFDVLSQLDRGIVKSKSRSVTSIILFEAISVGAAEALKESTNINITDFYDWVPNSDFNKLITGATNTKSRVLERIEYCKQKFLRNV